MQLAVLQRTKMTSRSKVRGYGVVRDGRLGLVDEAGFKRQIARMDGNVVVDVYYYEKPPSTDTFKYYYGAVVFRIFTELRERGETFSENEVHEMMKYKFLARPTEYDTPFIPSLSDLSQGEFSQFIEDCLQWASEVLNIFIPEPQ